MREGEIRGHEIMEGRIKTASLMLSGYLKRQGGGGGGGGSGHTPMAPGHPLL